jgi:hypothetical protein
MHCYYDTWSVIEVCRSTVHINPVFAIRKRVSRPTGEDMTTLVSGVWWNEAEKFLPFVIFDSSGKTGRQYCTLSRFSLFAVVLREIGKA